MLIRRPKLNEELNITVYSRGKIKEVFWVAINHLGMVENGKKFCSRPCNDLKLKIKVRKTMLPRSTFFVFATAKNNNKEIFIKDKVDVDFNQLSENYVRIFCLKFKFILLTFRIVVG